MSDDDRDDGHPARDAIEGLGLLFRAGRHAARKLKKEIDQSNLGRSIDDAGKEIVRAVDNVVGRIAGEPKRPTSSVPPRREGDSSAPDRSSDQTPPPGGDRDKDP